MKKILAGIQPTGRLHLGHYIGVLKPALRLQESGDDVDVMIASLHAMTTLCKKDINDNHKKIISILRELQFTSVFTQPAENIDLFWEIIAREPIGNLKHLPQFKSKEQTLGMLTYPVLMATDIILSECTHVLVGEDQEPHMEYYRYIARKHGYKKLAKSIVIKDSKVMSVKDPTKKMSKSLGDEHCIYLDDDLETIKAKLKKAPTDQDGLVNLKKIAKAFNYKYNSNQNSKSKEELAEVIHNHFN